MALNLTSQWHFLKLARILSNCVFLWMLFSFCRIDYKFSILATQFISYGTSLTMLFTSSISYSSFLCSSTSQVSCFSQFFYWSLWEWLEPRSDFSWSIIYLQAWRSFLKLALWGFDSWQSEVRSYSRSKLSPFFYVFRMLSIFLMKGSSSLLLVPLPYIFWQPFLCFLEVLQNQIQLLSCQFSRSSSRILLFLSQNLRSIQLVQKSILLANFQIQQTQFLVFNSTISCSQSSCILMYIFLDIYSIVYFLFNSSYSYVNLSSSSEVYELILVNFIFSFQSIYRSQRRTILSERESSCYCSYIFFIEAYSYIFFVDSVVCTSWLYFSSNSLCFYCYFSCVDYNFLYFQYNFLCQGESKN